MVAVIKVSSSVHRIVNYNENKVNKGVAECIGAGNYPVDHDKMSLNMKLNRLLKQNELHPKIALNSVHISLNFHPSELNLDTSKMNEIAQAYMEKIGFGNQPYLVYKHNDAGHPHIHIVSIKIGPDGKRIDMNNIGKNQSEQARKSIEKEYGLVTAESQNKQQQFRLKPISAKAEYGKSASKSAIQNVLDHVIDQYKYSSLHELNAVLKQYNVRADRGQEGSRVFKNNGLLYRILDEQGNPIGVPIKASNFYSKPTLGYLETKFHANGTLRNAFKARIKNSIDKSLLDKCTSLRQLIEKLDQLGIYTAIRQNEAGIIYGITYVDHKTKCVFNGSALGKSYSAKAIQERCQASEDTTLLNPPASTRKINNGGNDQQPALPTGLIPKDQQKSFIMPILGNVLDALTEADNTEEFMPNALKKKRKKRKKRKNL